MSDLTSIHDTIQHAAPDLTAAQIQPIVAALVAREDGMADMMRIAGMQFGLYPQIVAEVFAQIGIGTPIDETQRAMVRQGFNELMEQLQREHGQG